MQDKLEEYFNMVATLSKMYIFFKVVQFQI